MFVLPWILALFGIYAGRLVALKKGECPHRGKVWGAFLLPLCALVVPGLQFQALALSLAAALGAGLTAHRSVGTTFAVVFLLGAAATAGVYFSGY